MPIEINTDTIAEAVVSRSTVLAFMQVLAPFAPHFAEEVWARLGADVERGNNNPAFEIGV